MSSASELSVVLPNSFQPVAGGDVVNGADLVVTAIADGKRAATWVHQYLLSLSSSDSSS